eukprot:gene9505-3669_t
MAEHRILGEQEPVTRDHCVAISDICGAGGLYGFPKGMAGELRHSLVRRHHLASIVGSSALDFDVPVSSRGVQETVVLRSTQSDEDGLTIDPDSPSLLFFGGDAEQQPPHSFNPPLASTVVVFEVHLDSYARHVREGGYTTSDRSNALELLIHQQNCEVRLSAGDRRHESPPKVTWRPSPEVVGSGP